MADPNDQRITEAVAAVNKAIGGLSSPNIQDLAGEAVTKLTRAVNVCKTSPEVLDRAIPREDRANALRVVLKRAERKAAKSQVKNCLTGLLERPLWAQEARRDEELRGDLLKFLREEKCEEELCKCLEAKAGADVPEHAEPVPLISGPDAEAAASAAEAERAATKALLHSGYLALIEVDFKYPTETTAEMTAADTAIEAFGLIVKGIQRVAQKFVLVDASEERSVEAGKRRSLAAAAEGHKSLLEEYEAVWPKIVDFLATLYDVRQVERGRVEYVVRQLTQFSPGFAAACAEMTDLPWPSELPPAEAPPDDGADPDKEVERKVEESTPPVRSALRPGATYFVLWVDKDPGAYADKEVEVFTAEGLKVAGIHDDFETDPEKCVRDGMTLAKRILSSSDEELVAVIHSRGPTHCSIHKQLREFCSLGGIRVPYFAACTKATPEDFEAIGCKMDICDKDRAAVKAAVVSELNRRRSLE